MALLRVFCYNNYKHSFQTKLFYIFSKEVFSGSLWWQSCGWWHFSSSTFCVYTLYFLNRNFTECKYFYNDHPFQIWFLYKCILLNNFSIIHKQWQGWHYKYGCLCESKFRLKTGFVNLLCQLSRRKGKIIFRWESATLYYERAVSSMDWLVSLYQLKNVEELLIFLCIWDDQFWSDSFLYKVLIYMPFPSD